MVQKLLGERKEGLVFVVSAPSGTGKTTLVQKLLMEFPEDISRSVSCTTRPARNNEKEGVDYTFLSEEAFERKKQEGDFLETVQVFTHQYGTPRSNIEKLQRAGKHVILVIDVQGAMKIKKQIEAIYIFVAPPSHEDLEKRLRLRSTENEEDLEKRLDWAKKEMAQREKYDYLVVNEDLEIAYQILRSIVISEEKHIRGKNEKKE